MTQTTPQQHDDTFRNNQEAFEIVARVWWECQLEHGSHAIKLRTISKAHFGLDHRTHNRISEKAKGWVRSKNRLKMDGGCTMLRIRKPKFVG